jgi:hypothetical protein
MIGIVVSVRSRFAHGTSCTREEQFAERKCRVSRWSLRRNLPLSVPLTSLMQPRRTAEAAPSRMREGSAAPRGRVRSPKGRVDSSMSLPLPRSRLAARAPVSLPTAGVEEVPPSEPSGVGAGFVLDEHLRALRPYGTSARSALGVIDERTRPSARFATPGWQLGYAFAVGPVLFTPRDLRAQQVVTGTVLMRACSSKLCSHFAAEFLGHQRRRNAACTEGLLFRASWAPTFAG